MKSTMKAALALAFALLTIASRAQAESVTKNTAADPRGEVEIVNVTGVVNVSGWDRSEVQVQAELGREVERLDVTRDGDHTLIKVVLRAGHSNRGEGELVVRVPQGSQMTINTVSAPIAIENVRGTQRLQSVSGNVETQAFEADVQIKTVSGEVTISGQGSKQKPTAGQVRVTTVSGDIETSNLGSDIELHSVTGDMHVTVDSLVRARFNTTNGNVDVTGAVARDARIDAEAVNGDVEFAFGGAIDAEFDIETFNGDINNCFGPKARRSHEFGPGTELRFKEGAGQARVRVKTMNGGVTLCKKK